MNGSGAIVAKKPDEVAREWFQRVWNEHSEAAIDELLASDARMYGLPTPDGKPIAGNAGFKPFHRSFVSAFPDMRIQVVRTVTEGEYVAVHCRCTGTHAGHGLDVAPTQNPIDVWGMGMARVVDGRIVEAWNAFDFMTLYQQVGLLQKPPAGAPMMAYG
jgi:predicted ester cyclase